MTDWRAEARRIAVENGVNPDLFERLVQAESSFNPAARSPVGAQGFAQLMPATAGELGVDPSDPMQNLQGGARYLRQQLDRFGSVPMALAAYNAGPSRVAKAGGVPNIAETQNYVAKIMGGSMGGSGGADMLGGGAGEDTLMDGMQEQQPRGLLASLGIQKRDPAAGGETALPFYQRGTFKDTIGNLAIGLNSLRLNPDENLAANVQNKMQQRQDAAARNKTVDYLRRISPEAANLVDAGMFSPSEALAFSRDEKNREIAQRASDALQAGDMQTAYALSMLLSPTAMGQAIAQQAAPRQAEVIAGGKYTVTYGPDGKPVLSTNQAVIDEETRLAEIEAQKAQADANLPAKLQTVEEEDFNAVYAADALGEQISSVAQDFGYDPQTGTFNGPLQFGVGAALQSNLAMAGVGGQAAQEIRDARLRYERFITNYVNESLRLNKGTQTEGDSQRAMAAIDNAKTTADAWRAINDLQRINDRARQNRVAAIKARRERYGAGDVSVPEQPVGWSPVQ